ncbi:GNAT family N-acetyltransferase [Blastomonas sp.]|uniref:GNAT family N-acetyltransferase n=1 Tax=Blastomonas sp. TaxID=1909299 RepID=UPI00391BBA22
MTAPLSNDIDRDVVTRSLANCCRYWLNYGIEISHDDGVALHRSGIDFPLLNGVFRVDDPDPQTISDARSQLAGKASAWWVGPDSHPSTLEVLLQCGGTLQGSMPVYIRPLDELPTLTVPDGVSIDEIAGAAALDEWVACMAPSMGIPPGELERMKHAEHSRLDRPGQYRRFAARLDGRMIGTSAMFEAEGVAGIYTCSTAEPFRRQGIGAALTVAAARAAPEHGLDHATLQATPLGEPVYRRLGFRKVADYSCVMFAG